MHMILIHLHRIYVKLVPFRYFLKGRLQPLCQFTPQYHLPVLRGPHHMILEVVDRMTRSFNWAHAQSYITFIRLRRTLFSSTQQAGWYSTGGFYKSSCLRDTTLVCRVSVFFVSMNLPCYRNSFLKLFVATKSPAMTNPISTSVSRQRNAMPTPFKKISFRMVT
jgi:hypothetical protein